MLYIATSSGSSAILVQRNVYTTVLFLVMYVSVLLPHIAQLAYLEEIWLATEHVIIY